jgi:FixJ family two-component response regulator
MRILSFIKDRFPDSKVLIVSSAADMEMQKACFKEGADDFLRKPFDIEHLLSAVRRHAPEYRLDAA